MSKPVITLMLELTFLHDLDKHDVFSSFGVAKGPSNSSDFQHGTPSFIETVELMAAHAILFLHNASALLQMLKVLGTSTLHCQHDSVLLEMKRHHATMIRNTLKSFTFIMIIIGLYF